MQTSVIWGGIFFLLFIYLILGLISPRLVLRFCEKRTRWRVTWTFGVALLATAIVAASTTEKITNPPPKIVIDSPREAAPPPKPHYTEPMPLEKRLEIYWAVIQSEKRALYDSQQRYPAKGWEKEKMIKQGDYYGELLTKYRKEVLDEYDISEDELTKIIWEGVQNSWPQER